MNKYVVSGLVFVSLVASTGLYAVGCASSSGNMMCVNSSMPSLQVANNAKINNSTVQNDLTVGGKLSASQSGIGSLQVKSDTELNRVTVFGAANIGGDLMAMESSIKSLNVQGKTLLDSSNIQSQSNYGGDIAATKSTLTNSTTSAAKVKLVNSSASTLVMKKTNAVVCLNHSNVTNLSFSGKSGTVYLQDKNSHVAHLSGAKTINGKCPF